MARQTFEIVFKDKIYIIVEEIVIQIKHFIENSLSVNFWEIIDDKLFEVCSDRVKI
jgi:hypothetical protein